MLYLQPLSTKEQAEPALISGRKAFQRPMKEGIELLHAIQNVYLDPQVTIA
jgi:DhnA family fructose-bisphosphate aldolase class Ia